MNKAELVEQMSKTTGLPKSTCKICLEAFLAVTSETLKKKGTVVLTGFGKFFVSQLNERMGVHPTTKQPMQIHARTVPKFRPGRSLKDIVQI